MMTCLTRQEEILRDCEQMIPDTTRRLKDATTELHTYMVRDFVLLRRPVLAKQLGRQTSGTKLIRPWLPCRRKAKKKWSYDACSHGTAASDRGQVPGHMYVPDLDTELLEVCMVALTCVACWSSWVMIP